MIGSIVVLVRPRLKPTGSWSPLMLRVTSGTLIRTL